MLLVAQANKMGPTIPKYNARILIEVMNQIDKSARSYLPGLNIADRAISAVGDSKILPGRVSSVSREETEPLLPAEGPQ